MDWAAAWKYIFENWGTSTWKPIPEAVKNTLGLHGQLGMFRMSLVTRAGSAGITAFVQDLNRKDRSS